MPASHHLLTVGISLLTNYARERNLTLDEAVRRHSALGDFLHEDPQKACAELNSLYSRTGGMHRSTSDLAVTLVFTSTLYGKICASFIEKELKRNKIKVHRLPVRGVNAASRDLTPEFAARESAAALADLRQRVIAHIAKLQRSDPPPSIQLNCTGGYKAECAVLYELGRALRLPVYYLHESFRVVVEIP